MTTLPILQTCTLSAKEGFPESLVLPVKKENSVGMTSLLLHYGHFVKAPILILHHGDHRKIWLWQRVELELVVWGWGLFFSFSKSASFSFIPVHSSGKSFCAKLLSCAQLLATLSTIALRGPLCMGFSRQDTGVGWYFLLQGIFLTHGSNLSLQHWQADSFTIESPGKPGKKLSLF